MKNLLQSLKDCFAGLTGKQLTTGVYYKQTDAVLDPSDSRSGFVNENWQYMRADRVGTNAYEISASSRHDRYKSNSGFSFSSPFPSPFTSTYTRDHHTLPGYFTLSGVATEFYEFQKKMAAEGYHALERNPSTHYYEKAIRSGWTPPQPKTRVLAV